MSDVAITAASVKKGSSANYSSGTAGETITAGMPVYKKASDSKIYKAKANGTTEEADVIGIALNGASVDQPISWNVEDDDFTVGGTVAAGAVYVLSGAAYGGIAPVADITSGWYGQVLLVGKGSSKASLRISGNTDAVHA